MPKTTVETKFYEYIQNNSGGSFKVDKDAGIDHYVIIEAMDSNHANTRAKEIGIYFDGCNSGRDCSCCGDRWSEPYREGSEVPTIYGEPIDIGKEGKPTGVIHYMDGMQVRFSWEYKWK